jgi:hypothetical protein
MTDINPYALRVEMYKMAQERVTQEFYSKMDIARINFEKDGTAVWPVFPDPDTIVAEANKIRAFVDTK